MRISQSGISTSHQAMNVTGFAHRGGSSGQGQVGDGTGVAGGLGEAVGEGPVAVGEGLGDGLGEGLGDGLSAGVTWATVGGGRKVGGGGGGGGVGVYWGLTWAMPGV